MSEGVLALEEMVCRGLGLRGRRSGRIEIREGSDGAR